MKTIRHSVFETNSSSSHSISINNKVELYDSIAPNEDGNIVLYGGEFGWEWEKYNDSLTKANYCAIDVIGDEDRINMLIDVIKEHTGAKNVILDFTMDWNDRFYSYIDHQSCGTSNGAFTSKETLKNFIFNPKSILFTGNDNTTPLPNFYDADVDTFEYQLRLEGTDEIWYCTKEMLSSNEKIKDLVESLFSWNVWNEYSDNKTYWSSAEPRLYHIPWENEDNNVYDFHNNTLKIVKKEPVYDKKDRYKGEKVIDTKFLKFYIEKRDEHTA